MIANIISSILCIALGSLFIGLGIKYFNTTTFLSTNLSIGSIFFGVGLIVISLAVLYSAFRQETVI